MFFYINRTVLFEKSRMILYSNLNYHIQNNCSDLRPELFMIKAIQDVRFIAIDLMILVTNDLMTNT